MRWWPVFLRNLLVWRKLAIPSVIGNIAEPLMWLLAFGYGLGALVGEVKLGDERVPYLVFLASGSICMSAMNAATPTEWWRPGWRGWVVALEWQRASVRTVVPAPGG